MKEIIYAIQILPTVAWRKCQEAELEGVNIELVFCDQYRGHGRDRVTGCFSS